MPERSHVNLLIKYILFFLNFAIFLLSGAVTGLMTWILVLKEKKVDTAYDFWLDPSCVLCLGSSVGFFIAFFGWFGSLRENILCLKIYRYTLLFMFLLEATAIVLIFVVVYVPDARDQLGIYPENSLKKAIDLYRDDEDMQDLIDGIQELFECCGTSNDEEGYKDWTANQYFNCSSGSNVNDFGEYCSVPFSCCKPTGTGLINYLCGQDMQSTDMDPVVRTNSIYTRGCFRAISQILEDNVLVVGAVTIGILIPQMVLTGMTANLIHQIKMQMAKWNRMPPPNRT